MLDTGNIGNEALNLIGLAPMASTLRVSPRLPT